MSFFDDEPRRDAGRGAGAGLGRLNFSPEPLLGIVPFEVLYAAATANLTLTTTFANIVGATVTLVRPGVYTIVGVFLTEGAGAGDDGVSARGRLIIDGVAQAGVTRSTLRIGTVLILTVSQQWRYAKTALGPEVLQLQARKTGGTGTSTVGDVDTTLMAVTVPGSETLPT